MNAQALAMVETGQPIPSQADNDAHLIALWLGRHESRHTRRNYQRISAAFLAHVAKPLASVRLGDVQAYVASLADQAPATRALAVSALKSLFSFGHEVGFLRFNVGAALKAPAIKGRLAERIMTETDALKLIALEPDPRNRTILRLAYAAGLRISEVCGLTWGDCQPRDNAGQITVLGKGGKTRAVLLSPATWGELIALRRDAPASAPVFRSAKGGHLDASQVHRVVKAACKRAGLSSAVSCHWLRHGHASHSLDRGAPVHLVQATLGHASVATTGRYLHARPNDSSALHLAV